MEPLIGQAKPAGDLVKDSSERTFAADVLEVSRTVPVIVDFWAPWCGPCKTLGPALERAVTAAKGAVKMVKINIDENQRLAQQLRIQSIPAVYAFKGGQPVDGFVGAIPESQIKSFIQRLTGPQGPSPIDAYLEEAKTLVASGDLQAGAQLYAAILQEEPDNAAALAGLAKVYVTAGALDRAKETLALVPPDLQKNPEIESARAALSLAEQAGDAGEIPRLQAAVDANEKDHQARYDLALALVGAGRNEEAVDHLLEIIKADRTWNEEAARKQLLKLFEAFGQMDPLTQSARRRLSAILFK